MVVVGSMKKLLTVDFGEPLHCLVIVGETHLVEDEMLHFYALGKARISNFINLLFYCFLSKDPKKKKKLNYFNSDYFPLISLTYF
ncbi:hypothetical protein ACSBR2_000238 [Camellia fascicularis]